MYVLCMHVYKPCGRDCANIFITLVVLNPSANTPQKSVRLGHGSVYNEDDLSVRAPTG
jgi:hypothetical protein